MPDQARRLIENSDRGITLNKSLAWTIATAIIGAGLYLGIAMGNVTTSLEHMGRLSDSAKEVHRRLDERIGALEQSKARDDERFVSILSFMSKIDSRLERIENNRK